VPGPDLGTILTKLLRSLLAVVQEDNELRSHVRALAQYILAETEALETAAGVPPTALDDAAVGKAVTAEPDEPPRHPVALPPEILEGMKAAVLSMTSAPPVQTPVPVSSGGKGDVIDPIPIERRCRVKAEGARWAAKRQRLLAGGADYQLEIGPLDREIIERAKSLPDCFLWINHPSGPSPSDLSLLDDLAGCFDTTADAISLVHSLSCGLGTESAEFEQALNLLAEAQSALRAAVGRVGYGQDRDQLQTYKWTRDACWRNQVYIQRYMRHDDEADPSEWPGLGDRIQALAAQAEDGAQRRKRYESALKRIRYHTKLLLSGAQANASHDWQVIIETIDNMVEDGTPPSSLDLRELVLPVIEQLPDIPLPWNFRLVMFEVDRFLATRPVSGAEREGAEETEEVKQVAKLLEGKSLVLIGGVPRSYACEALKRAFGLKEVDWVETREHGSFSVCETHIARPDAAVVLLAIRWSSHDFGIVKQLCARHGKPLVRLPGGYNPNQVAVQIIQQCSEQL